MFAERSQALEVAWGGAWQSFEVCALRTFGPPLDSTADSALNRLYDSRYRGGGQGHRGPNYLLIRYHARPGDQLLNKALAVVCRQLGLVPQQAGDAAAFDTQFVSVPLSLAPLFNLNASLVADSPSAPRLDGLRCQGNETRVDHSPSNGILEVMWQCRYRKVCSDIWWGDIFNQDWPQAVSQNLAHVCASLGQPVSGSVLRYVYLDYRDRPLPPLFVPISGSCMAANESLELRPLSLRPPLR
eukprot:XP_001700523.1 predicted protein [Chlamydomonas reinhardtii]